MVLGAVIAIIIGFAWALENQHLDRKDEQRSGIWRIKQ